MARLIIFILFLSSIFEGISLIAVKDLFCKDPDTGKLYRVNSTWTSTSFCGRYTCRSRKRSDSEHPKSLQVLGIQNITKPKADDEILENNKTDSVNPNYNLKPTLISKVTSDNVDLTQNSDPVMQTKVALNNINGVYNPDPVLQSQFASNNVNQNYNTDSVVRKKVAANNVNLNYKPNLVVKSKVETNCNKANVATIERNSDGNRFLTEEEISAITLLLKTLKKGELDAILQVYRLAQDLYTEIDNIASMKSNSVDNIETNTYTRKGPSYWYEPLTITNFKVKPEHLCIKNGHRQSNGQQERTVKVPVTGSGPNENVHLSTNFADFITKLNKPHRRIIYSDSLTNENIKNIALYHRMTDFQRQASYLRPSTTPAYPQIYNYPEQKKILEPPVIPLSGSYQVTPENQFQLNDKLGIPHNYNMLNNYKNDPLLQKLKIYASILQNNGPQGLRTLSFPLSFIKQLTKNENTYIPFLSIARNRNYQTPQPTGTTLTQIPDAVFLTPDMDLPLPVKDSVEDTINPSEEFRDWITGPVGVRLFTDVKSPEEAIKATNLLPLPFKKSKMIKTRSRVSIIDVNRRRKRDIKVQSEELEAYLEKTTCQTEMEPGFFRMGDPTQPYPACCPQRVGKDSR